MPNYRNPNGFGSVVKLAGHRRKPYAVRKTIGWDDRAYPIYAIVGYYPTRKDALIALSTYNADPYDIDLSKSTFAQIYEKFAEVSFPTMGRSLMYAHRASYKYCTPLYNMPYREIKKYQMQKCIDDCDKSYATKMNIKNLLTSLDKFAYDMEVISKMNSLNLTTAERETVKTRKVFTDEEVRLLWQHRHESCVDETLFMLYTGCRMSEMLTLECANVDLENGIMTGGIKTASGKNRIIPIHSKLRPIIEEHLSSEKYLFSAFAPTKQSRNPEAYMKNAFFQKFTEMTAALNLQHTTHECRHTFRSKLDSAGANKVCIDLIMGHKSQDTGERVYTHKTIEELKSAIEKLSYETERVSNTLVTN